MIILISHITYETFISGLNPNQENRDDIINGK